MRRKIFYWLAPLALLLVAAAAALSWLFATESGLRWSYARLRSMVPGTLDVDALEGRLMGPIHIRGLRYRSPSLDARVGDVTLDWSPLALAAGRLQIEKLQLRGARIALLPSPATAESGPTNLRPPLPIRIRHFAAEDIQVQRGTVTPYEVQTLEFAGGIDAQTLRVENLKLQAAQFQVTARGALGSSGAERLEIDARMEAGRFPALAAHGVITGNLSDVTLEINVTAPINAQLHAKVENALTQLAWQATVEIPEFDLHRLQPNAKGSAGLQLNARGGRERFTSSGTLRGQYPGWPSARGAFRLSGTTTGALTLEEMVVTAPGLPARVTARGDWNLAQGAFRTELHWADLRWPLTDQPFLLSPTGCMEVNGLPASYRFSLAADVGGARIPPAALRASGSGDLARFTTDTLAINTMEATLQGTARVEWTPRLDWTARLEGQGLNPGTMWAEWAGKLAVAAEAAGNAEEIRLDLSRVAGELRGRAVSARARLVRRGTEYPVLALTAQSGSATVNVNGGVRKEWNLSWQVTAPDLSALWPDARGQARGTGTIRGRRDTPTVNAQIAGTELTYEQFYAGTLDADVQVDMSDQQSSRIRARLADAAVGQQQFDQLALTGEGLVSNHALTLNAGHAEQALQLALTGGYRNARWRGSLTRGQWKIGPATWTLDARAALDVSAAEIDLAQTCWSSNAAARLCARVRRTADGDITLAGTATRVPLALLARALDQPLGLRGRFDGNADLALHGGRIRKADAHFVSAPGSLRWTTASTGTALAYQRATVDMRVDDNGLRARADVQLENGDTGSADIALPEFSAPTPRGDNQLLRGNIALAVRDLSPFAALVPEIEQLQGALRVNLSLQGTLGDPQVRGDARLTDGGARIPALGIRLQEVRLVAAPDGRDLRLNGYARSGEGGVGISGRFTFGTKPPWQAEVRLAAAGFQAVNIAEAGAIVTTDLRLRISPGTVSVQGEVNMPQARFAPRPQRAAIEPSPDVVIENGGPATEQRPSAWAVTADVKVTLGDNVSFEGFGLSGNISGNITLIDTPAQVTTARGELNVSSGRYEAYGQKLEIERGRLLFAGGPVDNPGIDARAVRRLQQTTAGAQVTVGVEVKGTLKSPELALFSDPAMGQSDTLSYLLFGRPADTANPAQGAAMAAAARALKLRGGEALAQRIGARFGIEEVDIQNVQTSTGAQDAALVLGKRLSPRLYVNYSIGLIEPVSVFRIRYELTKNWVLQAESGLNQGADLLYTIER